MNEDLMEDEMVAAGSSGYRRGPRPEQRTEVVEWLRNELANGPRRIE